MEKGERRTGGTELEGGGGGGEDGGKVPGGARGRCQAPPPLPGVLQA